MALSLLPLSAESIRVGQLNRSYITYVPRNLGTNRPLLISCHGMNQDANYQKGMLKIETVADTAKFVTVFPEGIDKSWDISGNRDINFMLALIDEMVEKYSIDPCRVYLSGFSMGGMFTYHAMNKIADKIAAFAPISGYPMWGGNFSSSRPIPIIHTHGTGDDVVTFSGVQGILDGWINRNGCPKTAKVTPNYRGTPHITRHYWGPGTDGVEVVLMELADKGHWIANDYGVKTGDEIWRFCSRYSLHMTKPYISITAPQEGLTYTSFAPNGEATFPEITVTVNTGDPNGKVAKVDFYIGNNLFATATKKPYKATLTTATAGKHTLRAVVTDNDGETASASVMLTLSAPQTLNLSSAFKTDGTVPDGWVTYDGSERRIGFTEGLTKGCRIMAFTASRRSFAYGLYFRNLNGTKRQGWAKYGLKSSTASLTLTPGTYKLTYKACNWDRPDFSPVTVQVERRNGSSVAAQTYTPTVNIGNNTANNFAGAKQQVFEFEIAESGEYVLAFYTADAASADVVLGQCILASTGYQPTTVQTVRATDSGSSAPPSTSTAVYDLQGRHVSTHNRGGLYIRNGRKYLIK